MNCKPGLLIATMLLLEGCEDVIRSPQLAYKASGSAQCEASKTTQPNLEAEVAALRAAGATVLRSGCSNDGLAHPTVCGAPNGDLFSIEVPAKSAEIIKRAGFRPAAEFPSALAMPCRASP